MATTHLLRAFLAFAKTFKPPSHPLCISSRLSAQAERQAYSSTRSGIYFASAQALFAGKRARVSHWLLHEPQPSAVHVHGAVLAPLTKRRPALKTNPPLHLPPSTHTLVQHLNSPPPPIPVPLELDFFLVPSITTGRALQRVCLAAARHITIAAAFHIACLVLRYSRASPGSLSSRLPHACPRVRCSCIVSLRFLHIRTLLPPRPFADARTVHHNKTCIQHYALIHSPISRLRL